MKYQQQIEFSVKTMKYSRITKKKQREMVLKNSIMRLLDSMPLEELDKIFDIQLIDPEKKATLKLLSDPNTPDYLKKEITYLKEYDLKKYRIGIEL